MSVRHFIPVIVILLSAGWALPLSAQDEKGEAEGAVESSIASKSASVQCQDGFVDIYPCSNVDMVSFLPLSEMGAAPGIGLNDAWGWVDPDTGQRWALVGREDGVAFVEITDPAAPRYAGELPKPSTANVRVWRDIKVDGYFAFVVADGGSDAHGMQVFDLRRLRSAEGTPVTFDSDAHYQEFGVAHNVVVNEESDRAYVVGSRSDARSCNSGLHIVDIADPLNPTFLGCFFDEGTGRAGGGYTHDAQCVVYHGPDVAHQGREICVGSNETAISIADVTDPDNPVGLSRGSYPSSSYVHQGWFTEDQRYFIQNDELDERVFDDHTHTFIWDLTDLDDPVLLTDFASDVVSTDHNLYVRGRFVYQANYSSGLRIMDISDPSDPFIAGYFDTRPTDSAVNFNGAWTAWPFPDSDLVIISSRGEGLFVVQPAGFIGTRFTEFEASASGEGIVDLQWEMNTVSGISHFEILQVENDGTELVVSSFAPQSDSDLVTVTTLTTGEGIFRFRIAAVGEGGGRIESADIVVNVLAGTHLLDAPWPNPTHATSQSRLAVSLSQKVRVVVHDALGRERMRIFDGRLTAEQQLDIDLDATGLEPGAYYLHVVGEQFSDTRPFVVTK